MFVCYYVLLLILIYFYHVPMYPILFQATQAKMWICFDGPLQGKWIDLLDGLISKNKVIQTFVSVLVV